MPHGRQVTFLVVDRGRARRSVSLHTVSTLAPGPPSFSALANNEDLAVNLDELSVE